MVVYLGKAVPNGSSGGGAFIDQTYDATSTNAQSGTAVAEALATLDLTAYQTTANLVTSLSNASTDTEYPSAKCVYDIIGDVESLLAQV